MMLADNEKLLKKDNGLHLRAGRYKGVRNIIYFIENTETYEKYCKMTCNKDNNMYTILSNEDIEFIINMKPYRICWTYMKGNGYVYGKLANKNNSTLHSYVMSNKDTDDINKNDRTLSIDHINRNKLDNSRKNLRWATQSLQNSNTGKRARKFNACSLPPELTHEMMPKYVVYYKECYNKENDLWREFLKIEKHPKSSKSVCSSKSTKLTILQKLEEIKLKIHNIENDIVKEKKIPKYHTIQNYRNAPHLVYDRRIDKLRINLRMKLNPDVDIEEELQRFQDKLKIKHPDYIES